LEGVDWVDLVLDMSKRRGFFPKNVKKIKFRNIFGVITGLAEELSFFASRSMLHRLTNIAQSVPTIRLGLPKNSVSISEQNRSSFFFAIVSTHPRRTESTREALSAGLKGLARDSYH
jgi:hypothetical protein